MWTVEVTVKDGEKHESVVACNLPGSIVYDDAYTMAEAFGAHILALTDGRIERIRLVDNTPDLPAGNPAVGAGAGDVEIKGIFHFIATGDAGDFAYRISVPAIKAAMKLAGSDRLDTAQAAVTNFREFMLDGNDVLDPTVGPVDSRGYDIVAWVAALETYSKKRKPLAIHQ